MAVRPVQDPLRRDAVIMAEAGNGAAQQVPEGAAASNVVTLQRPHAVGEASHESVDEAQLLEETNPDSQEPARGKNKRSKE